MPEKYRNLNLDISEETAKTIDDYISFFREYNEKVNLVGKNDVSVLFEKHIYDSFSFNLFSEKYKLSKKMKIIDIGTGGGFPSVPLAFVYKDAQIFATDSIRKKINFIETVKEKYKLNALMPVCSRFEDLDKKYVGYFDVALSRAVAELPVILEYSLPFVRKGGYFVAYKSVKAEDEIKSAKNALKILKAELIDKIEYTLPIDGINKRVLLIFKKTGNTPVLYPRQNGLPKKNPL